MRVGPMPMFAAAKLVGILEKNGVTGDIVPSGETFEPENQPTGHPRIETQKDLCFVDFDDEHLPLVKPELVRLALVVEHDQVSSGDELDGDDWMCVKCKYVSLNAGLCPEHREPLVTFEDYAAMKRNQSAALPGWLWIAIIGCGLIAAYTFKML